MKNKIILLTAALVMASAAFADETITYNYFYTPTCPKCRKLDEFLKPLQQKYPQVEIKKYNMSGDIENLSKLRQGYNQHQVPMEKWAGTLAFFSWKKYYTSADDIIDNLEREITDRLIELKAIDQTRSDSGLQLTKTETGVLTDTRPRQQTKPSLPVVPRTDLGADSKNLNVSQTVIDTAPIFINKDNRRNDSGIIDIFNQFGTGTIILAGLIDGINPCAFVTIIFFISYLTLIKKTRKEILSAGMLFTFGVFAAYFMIGMGLFRAVYNLSSLPYISKFIYKAIGLVCLAFALISFLDCLKLKHNNQENVTLKLPDKLVRWIHGIIRYQVKARYLLPISLAAGFGISVIEFACTGQIYLPVIMYIIKTPGLRFQATLYLFIYVIMFIIPLQIVFLFVYFGLSSDKLKCYSHKYLYVSKLLLTLVFLGLALFMLL